MKRVAVLGIPALALLVVLAVVVTYGGDEPPQGAASDDIDLPADGGSPTDASTPDPRADGVIVLAAEDGLYRVAPDGTSLGKVTDGYPNPGLSFDGAWQAWGDCSAQNQTCRLAIADPKAGNTFDTDAAEVKLGASFANMGQWARASNRFAALDTEKNLYVVEAATRSASRIAGPVSTFTWTAQDGLLFATEGAATAAIQRYMNGELSTLATVAGPVTRLFHAPDGVSFAFAQNDAEGWRLVALDSRDGRLTDYGHLGAVPERGVVTAAAPNFAISWTADQNYLAVSAVDSPFLLHVFDAAGKPIIRHFFEEGYAGELKWSPDNEQLAISTYSPDRSRHEVYVLDAGTPGGDVRHLIKGCRVIWSPDGVFLAVKQEPHTEGAGIVDVASGAHWSLARNRKLTPVSWGIDDAAAVHQALELPAGTNVLGK